MEFELTDEQRRLRDETRAFVREEVRPRAIALDRGHEYPADVLAELGDRRLAGLTLPEEYGGRGEGLVELAVVTEELAAGLMSVASALALHLGVATVVERFGTDAQRDEFLPEMATFDHVGALGLTETDAGSDKLAMETTAERDGDEWVLDGEKAWVTNFPNADVVLTSVIRRYRDEPTAVTGAEQAALNRVSITVAVRYYDQVEEETILEEQFTASQEYDPARGLSEEIAAAQAALENIAEDVFTAATSDW